MSMTTTSQSETSLRELGELVLRFSRERDWEQFHNPKDLAIALAIEVGEVLEHFRFQDDARIRAQLADAVSLRSLGHELADCLWLLIRLADVCSLDLGELLREKVELAGAKYPVSECHGLSIKYTKLPPSPPTGTE
jgi:dCTP diphosphatase